jgi:hypothetical protein
VAVALHIANVVMAVVEQQVTVALAADHKQPAVLVHLQVMDIQEQMALHTLVEIQKMKAVAVAVDSAAAVAVVTIQLVAVAPAM